MFLFDISDYNLLTLIFWKDGYIFIDAVSSGDDKHSFSNSYNQQHVATRGGTFMMKCPSMQDALSAFQQQQK